MMGVSAQNLMREHSELVSMRDLLLVPHFQAAFPSQEAGDACLMEGGIVHRGPATQGARTSSGRLQLFWVVTPTLQTDTPCNMRVNTTSCVSRVCSGKWCVTTRYNVCYGCAMLTEGLWCVTHCDVVTHWCGVGGGGTGRRWGVGGVTTRVPTCVMDRVK